MWGYLIVPSIYCGAYIKSTSSGGGNAQKICAQFKRNVKIQVGLDFFVLQGRKCFKFVKSETFGNFHYHCDGISTFSDNRITWIYLAEHNNYIIHKDFTFLSTYIVQYHSGE